MVDVYYQMALESEKYKAPGVNVELECRMIIPTVDIWTGYKEVTIPYFRSPLHSTLSVRKAGGVIETKELASKRSSGNVGIFISIEKEYCGRFPEMLIPHITRYVQRKVINKNPLVVINLENGIFTLEVEYTKSTVEKCKEIIDMYTLPFWPSPKPIDAYSSEFISKILHGKYCLSAKADGEHVMIYTGSNDDNLFYIKDNGQVVGKRFNSPAMWIMEGELISSTIYIFDVLVANGCDIRQNVLKERRKNIPQKLGMFMVKEKQIYPFSTYNGFVKAYRKCMDSNEIPNDGVIMTSMGAYSNIVYKSKPIPTVDLQYINGFLFLANEKSSVRVPAGDVCLEDGMIYEFDMGMNLIRERKDKIIPNYRMPVEVDPVANIITGYGIPCLRYHHNYVKLKMLKLLPQTTLLDIGSGYGGDVDKWDGFSKVYAVDPQLKLRKKTDNIVSLRCRIQEVPDIRTDSVSMFFVPWDSSILPCIVSANHVVMIVMNNAISTKNDLYTVEKYSGKIHVSIPGTATAENIVENSVDVDKIDAFMQDNGFECIQIVYDMKFGCPLEIQLSKMYSYLYYRRK